MSEGGKKDIEATIKFPLTNANQWFRLLSGDVGRLYIFSVEQKIMPLSMERHNHLSQSDEARLRDERKMVLLFA